jgi:two-component system, cell cycle sensor histidine kinase PleC
MNLAPRRPSFDLPMQAAELRNEPAFEIDAQAGLILGANPAGWQAWGLDRGAVVLPLAVDRAMPALERLRAVAAQEQQSLRGEMLTFWTAAGLVELACDADRIGSGACFVVRAVRPPLLHPGATTAPAAERDGAALDAALPARLAHELRTPLSAVIAYAEILKDEHFGPLANERYRAYARDIHESARHALGVVDAMLDNPQEPRTRQLVFADLEPAVIVEGCVAVARPLAEGAGLVLDADYAPGLPRVIADEVSLRQMLLNLLTNAVKFARRGDRVSVAVVCRPDGLLDIIVSDTGPGIEHKPSGDGAVAPGCRKGLGLGLPLTRALAAANGATFALASGPGQGTRATISFGKDRLVPV